MNTLKDLYIIGAGGFGNEVAWLVERINECSPTWNLKGFIDDNASLWGTKRYNGYEVIGGIEYLRSCGEIYAVCAIGSGKTRKSIIEKLSNTSIRFATLIDPSVIRPKTVEIGEGTIICAGTIASVGSKIGNHVIVNLDCTVGHDVTLRDYATLNPSVNLSGNVLAKSCTEFGTGTQVIQGKRIAENAITGAGAVVVRDITEAGTYVGVPARKIEIK